MSVIWTVLVGFIVGVVARFLKPGKDPFGFIITTALGIGGALLATYGGQSLGLYHAGEPAGFIGSVIGAILILVLYNMVAGKKAGS